MKPIQTIILGSITTLLLLSCQQELPQPEHSEQVPTNTIALEADITAESDESDELRALFNTDTNGNVLLGDAGVVLPEHDLYALVYLSNQKHRNKYVDPLFQGITKITLKYENGKHHFKGKLYLNSGNNDGIVAGGTYDVVAFISPRIYVSSGSLSYLPSGAFLDNPANETYMTDVIHNLNNPGSPHRSETTLRTPTQRNLDIPVLYGAHSTVVVKANTSWVAGKEASGGELKISQLRFKPRGQFLRIRIKNNTSTPQTIENILAKTGLFSSYFYYSLDAYAFQLISEQPGSSRGYYTDNPISMANINNRFPLTYGSLFVTGIYYNPDPIMNPYMYPTELAHPIENTFKFATPITLAPGETSAPYYTVVSPMAELASAYPEYLKLSNVDSYAPPRFNGVKRSTIFEINTSSGNTIRADINGRGTEIFTHNSRDQVVRVNLTIN